ncbi:beta-N-acetylhexosaminidase [Aliidiomarina shirensis]|uniref:Beta-hexosaminidase n=1 Tax=Aliidiomarina shirensis TaxID=1048642 RepID=A0A432WY42_9GAMM|nr:beta-N-acetylhexosaminidase [Aliidiomarina shirensis]RUO38692.1 beta-N-acetylhexosaminidase [Aliidiomarina shirensis]
MSGLILDFSGTHLTEQDRELLAHPAVAGVILFTRNYENPEQLAELTADIRDTAKRDILITVDHEGGRVQRFRPGFSAIPAMGHIQEIAKTEAQQAALAREMGWLMASELLACGVDHSFAPVLDIHGPSQVIGDRAFADNPSAIVWLANAFIRGMHEAGMRATGKHFPGHGTVVADSHVDIPVDDRSLADILEHDGSVFAQLAQNIQAVMPAHVIYPQVAPEPAGFSEFWLQTVLRDRFEFQGVIISDDLLMAGATVAGTVQERAEKAIAAGCDLLLVCNDQSAARAVLADVTFPEPSRDSIKILQGKSHFGTLDDVKGSQRWKNAQKLLEMFLA